MKHLIIALSLTAIAACAETPTSDQDQKVSDTFEQIRNSRTAPKGDCPFEPIQPFVGQHVSVLEKVMLLGQVRVIRPGQMVTMDYMPTRLNIELDKHDAISRLRCG